MAAEPSTCACAPAMAPHTVCLAICRAAAVLRHLAYVSPNAAELVAMANAVRRRRGQPPASSRAPSLPVGAEHGALGARELIHRLLPSLQTLLEVCLAAPIGTGVHCTAFLAGQAKCIHSGWDEGCI